MRRHHRQARRLAFEFKLEVHRHEGKQRAVHAAKLVDLGEQGRKIYVFPFPEGSKATTAWGPYRVFDDTWDTSQPLDSGLTPPPDLLEPQRGFGKVWREVPEVRRRLAGGLPLEGCVPAAVERHAIRHGLYRA